MVKRTRGYVPDRGDAVWITLDPQTGHEQAGRRPALVLSPAAYNGRAGLALLCPITNQAKGYPFEVLVPRGLRIGGVVLADQVKSLHWRARKMTRICTLPEDVVAAVMQRLQVFCHLQADEKLENDFMLSCETLEMYRRMTTGERLALTLRMTEAATPYLLAGTPDVVKRRFQLLRMQNDERNRNTLQALARSRKGR